MTPGWYSIGDEALHWFADMGHNAAKSLCGMIWRASILRQANGSYCLCCELKRLGLWDGKASELRAA